MMILATTNIEDDKMRLGFGENAEHNACLLTT